MFLKAEVKTDREYFFQLTKRKVQEEQVLFLFMKTIMGWVCGWVCVWVCVLVTHSCLTLQSHGLWPTYLLCPWDFPGKNTAVGSHSLLQGIFQTQGSNLGFLHCRQILLMSEPQEKSLYKQDIGAKIH